MPYKTINGDFLEASVDYIGDLPIDRFRYFSECLEAIVTLNQKTIGIPYKIGCGLGGGNWTKYELLIRQWSERNPDIDVSIY